MTIQRRAQPTAVDRDSRHRRGALEETLVSVLENRPESMRRDRRAGLAYDDPWNIREEVRFVQAPAGLGPRGLRQRGRRREHGRCDPRAGRRLAGDRRLDGSGRSSTSMWRGVGRGRAARGGRRRPACGPCRPASVVRRGGRSVAVDPCRAADIVTAAAPSAPALEAGFWRADVLAGGRILDGLRRLVAPTPTWRRRWRRPGSTWRSSPSRRVVTGPARSRPGFLRRRTACGTALLAVARLRADAPCARWPTPAKWRGMRSPRRRSARCRCWRAG